MSVPSQIGFLQIRSQSSVLHKSKILLEQESVLSHTSTATYKQSCYMKHVHVLYNLLLCLCFSEDVVSARTGFRLSYLKFFFIFVSRSHQIPVGYLEIGTDGRPLFMIIFPSSLTEYYIRTGFLVDTRVQY